MVLHLLPCGGQCVDRASGCDQNFPDFVAGDLTHGIGSFRERNRPVSAQVNDDVAGPQYTQAAWVMQDW